MSHMGHDKQVADAEVLLIEDTPGVRVELPGQDPPSMIHSQTIVTEFADSQRSVGKADAPATDTEASGTAGHHSFVHLDDDTDEAFFDALEHPHIVNDMDVPPEVPRKDGSLHNKNTFDIVHRVSGMYRLVDLVAEEGSAGVVEKVIIDSEGMRRFLDAMFPGAYTSITRVNFRAMDSTVLHAIGIYGSKEGIVQFLRAGDKIDVETAALLLQEGQDVDRPSLRSGLYIVRSDSRGSEGPLIYVVYWPETTTWNGDASPDVKRNRVTFMRYLTKLCDQVLAFISPEHSAKLSWGEDSDADDEDELEDQRENSRLISFQVKKTTEIEDNVEVFPGIKVEDRILRAAETPGLCDGNQYPRLVVGDTQQAVLSAEAIQRSFDTRDLPINCPLIRLQDELARAKRVEINNAASIEDIRVLVDNGLESIAPAVCSEWRQDMDTIRVLQLQRQSELDAVLDREPAEREQQQIFVAFKLAGLESLRRAYKYDALSDLFETHLFGDFLKPSRATSPPPVPHDSEDSMPPPHVTQHHVALPSELEESISAEWNALASSNPELAIAMTDLRRIVWHSLLKETAYVHLKSRFIAALELCAASEPMDMDEQQLRALSDCIISGRGPRLGPPYERPKGALRTVQEFFKGFNPFSSEATLDPVKTPDPTFITIAIQTAMRHQWLEPTLNHLLDACATTMARLVHDRCSVISHTVTAQIHKRRENDIRVKFEKIATVLAGDAQRKFVKDMALMFPKQTERSERTLCVASLKPGACSTMVRIYGHVEIPRRPAILYTLRFLGVSANDQAAIRSDPAIIPSPRILEATRVDFELPPTSLIRYLQLLDSDKVLLVVEDEDGLEIFVEKRADFGNATFNHRPKKSFKREKLAPNAQIAYDEGSRLLVLLSAEQDRCLVHAYAVDDQDCSVRARGPALDIFRWFESTPAVTHICFVSGSNKEEICIAEASGRLRIFSLVTETCRPASLHLPTSPKHLFAAPDGSCLFLVFPDGAVVAHHWDGFGSSDGIAVPIPDIARSHSVVLTSIALRSCVHLLVLHSSDRLLVSHRLRIQRKTSEFHLRKDARAASATQARVSTVHNCLVECLAEVWTRFPVVPAIAQDVLSVGHAQTRITYVCEDHHDQFQSHYSSMVRRFERVTRKPTQRVLDRTFIDALTLDTLVATGINWPISSARGGDWVIKAISLLPIQIAVARDNRFLPLKDGVWATGFEQQTLGSSVNQIADNITFGWYESIFTHYDKPVKVVSSMGEQSTGKSYMLAHLVDTSFAGSAMRCTEGVWMCVTPTAHTLFVALDFEGVHSLERSVQEDALLVLFNAAISNLILFRNNFALSRNIAGMFTSFQSSSSLFDPEVNPTLFQSCLVIIIKDVVDADTDGIIQEFEDKFQRIVADEQEDNFLTRLHRGQLRIMPWPVIESRKYYTAYSGLKQELLNQPVSQPRAGVFLHTLKTLMAKIKACDWGALDQNLAAHRAEQLRASLPKALSSGVDDNDEALRDLDSSTVIPHSDTAATFHLAGPTFNIPDDCRQREGNLARLRISVDVDKTRQDLPDTEWMAEFCQRLEHLVEARIAHVKDWFTVNSTRFDAHADIQQVGRMLEAGIIELRDAVSVCGVKCSKCSLLCTASKRHANSHDCQTSHACKHTCSFLEEHEQDAVSCGQPAGHPGRHICEVGAHLCGRPCVLLDRPGCMGRCMKPVDHPDEGHFCAARTHECGESCALGRCGERCAIPHDEAHTAHDCKARGCPYTCLLCKRLCASADHFHGLLTNATHLCGQEHACEHQCASEGFCEVSTEPIAIETTFTGRHDTFQYTKYMQSAKKLVCAVVIRAGETSHHGPHVHDTLAAKPFHYCPSRCPSCGYVCNLPYGHPQLEHETAHGSMSSTEWAIEGGDNVSIELQGHRFGAGDIGAPMLCSVYCTGLGRHAHIDYCKTPAGEPCGGREQEHISVRMTPNAHESKDYITHALFWRRSGFKDPYSHEDKAAFKLCDAQCSAPEHASTATTAAQPAYCTSQIFHPPHPVNPPPPTGYVSNDGHYFACANPAVTEHAYQYHIMFVIDRSTSMRSTDNLPLPGTPVTARIARQANNRLGSVFSAVYGMWTTRHGAGATMRRDAYSVILFSETAVTAIENDMTSGADTLLNRLLSQRIQLGTNFNRAIQHTQRVMESHWNNERIPVVIFLSDGEGELSDSVVTALCRRAVALGKPLVFHAVSYGRATHSGTLDRMVTRAREVYRAAPNGGANADTQCTSTRALNTVRLAETFISIADSLSKPRAALMKSGR